MKSAATITLLAIALTGCAANSSTKLVRGQNKLQPHADPVCLLKSPLPGGISHTVIGEVRGGKKTYGSMQEVLSVMGNEARSIGADAIINVKTRHDVNAWAWARPVANGNGVKLENKADFDCLKLGGEFR
jgi:hypothetical protein